MQKVNCTQHFVLLAKIILLRLQTCRPGTLAVGGFKFNQALMNLIKRAWRLIFGPQGDKYETVYVKTKPSLHSPLNVYL